LKTFAGQTIGALNIRTIYNVTISRIIRRGIEFPRDPHLPLQIGDRLQLVGSPRAIDNLERELGNDIDSSYGVDALSLIVGLALGFLIGDVPISPFGIVQFTLGKTGGVLVAAMILSALYKTGPLVWVMPQPSNDFIREIGLYLFLAVVGVSAGAVSLKRSGRRVLSCCCVAWPSRP
jgi:putative transport protein